MRRLHFALLSMLLVLAAQPLFATTYYVTPPLSPACTSEKGGFVIFPSIQYAVTHVPAGSTINICPGTYYEQVTISQPLTLRGVSYSNSSNSSKAIIAMPGVGLTTTPSLYYGGTVAPQVEVTAEAVNITGITVDGTASSSNCPSANYVGIFYSSGSSGTVDEVETRYQNCANQYNGDGILAENGDSSRSVTIENSNIHDYSGNGILAYGTDYTVSIKNNYVYSSVGITGIAQLAHAGDVSDNAVTETGGYGIAVFADVVVSGNMVSNTSDGIDVQVAATVTSNRISNSTRQGVGLYTGGATIKDNIIIQPSTGVGIEFGCNTNNTVSGNTINGAATGIDFVPAAFNGVNTFYSVSTVRTSGC